MKNVHPEFSFQSRELEGQIEGTLGDPPNRKNYDMMVNALCPSTPTAAASTTST